MSSNILGVLGQSNPSAGILTNLYTVPINIIVPISHFTVTNLSGANDSFYISVAPAGAADALSQYLYYNVAIDGSDTFMVWFSFYLSNGDIVRCMSSGGNLTFQVFGGQS